MAKRARYRKLLVGSVLVGAVAGVGLRSVGYPLVGEALYWVGIVGFLAVWQGTSVKLFDERDHSLERRASQLTLSMLAPVLVVGASLSRLATWLDWFAVPTAVRGALYGYVTVYVVFSVAYLWLRYRS
ncbi:MAG: DUF2178 domain-containing protein [Halolamina sp.]